MDFVKVIGLLGLTFVVSRDFICMLECLHPRTNIVTQELDIPRFCRGDQQCLQNMLQKTPAEQLKACLWIRHRSFVDGLLVFTTYTFFIWFVIFLLRSSSDERFEVALHSWMLSIVRLFFLLVVWLMICLAALLLQFAHVLDVKIASLYLVRLLLSDGSLFLFLLWGATELAISLSGSRENVDKKFKSFTSAFYTP